MKFNFTQGEGIIVQFVFEEDSDSKSIYFTGKSGEIFPVNEENKILVGLGKKEDFDREQLKSASYKLGRFIGDKEINNIKFSSENVDKLEDKNYLFAIIEGLYLSSYNFDYYKSEKDKFNLENIYFALNYSNVEELENEVREFVNLLDSQLLARDLVNKRSNDIYPETLAKECVDNLSNKNVTVKVYDKEKIEELGLKAFLAVARGSENEPKFIIMEYLNGGEEKPLVFVGKGLTYDSGGYSLKPRTGMVSMKYDMSGAANVLGMLKTLVDQKKEVNVVAVLALAENMVKGNANRADDVVIAKNGLSVEISNTDAEGRLVLGDAVTEAVTYEPVVIMDFATLTGAVIGALGESRTGIFTNQIEEYKKEKVGEKLWHLPMDESDEAAVKDTPIADILNSNLRPFGGASFAAAFINQFTEGYPWLHFDIAGTSQFTKSNPYGPKAASGVMIRTVVDYILEGSMYD